MDRRRGRCRRCRSRGDRYADQRPLRFGDGAAGANPVVLGAAAAAVACAVAGSVVLALTVGNDRSADPGQADPPAVTRKAPPTAPNSKPPSDNRTDRSRTDAVAPAVDEQTDAATSPVPEPTIPPVASADPTSVPPTQPPPTQPPPTQPPPTQPPPTQEPAAPHLTGLEAHRSGLPVVGPWKMGVSLVAEGTAPITLRVEYRFRELVVLLGRSGAGWRCDGVISALNPLDGPVDCTYAYSGGAVPEIVLNVLALVPDPRSGPSASVRLYSDGKLVDAGTF